MKTRNITYSFNKEAIKNPNVPQWIVKHMGNTHYVHLIRVSSYKNTKGRLKLVTTDDGKLMAKIS